MRLLAALGADPAGYVASSIRLAILDEVKDMSAAHAKTITTALRCYLRFLGASGECRPDLIHAVPTIPQWRLSAIPRYLPIDDVERLIASCDTSLAQGVRDKAILLLLSRLGLRAGDVLALRLDHLCWADGTLRVAGKDDAPRGRATPGWPQSIRSSTFWNIAYRPVSSRPAKLAPFR
jgi:site-specific recombinase XerC